MTTKNFNPKIDKMLTCQCGHAECDKRTVDQDALEKLQLMRDDLGAPMIITSGARCPFHKEELGRTRTDHQSKKCVDIAYKNELELVKLLVLAGRHGATRVAFSERLKFVHVSFIETGRKDVVTWSYK